MTPAEIEAIQNGEASAHLAGLDDPIDAIPVYRRQPIVSASIDGGFSISYRYIYPEKEQGT